MRLSAEQRRRQQRIIDALSKIELALPGSIEVRRTTCGKPTCRCHGNPDDRHGPYIVWTRKVAGRTVTRVLTDAQFAEYRDYLETDRRLRQLVDELHQLTLQVVEADQSTTRKPRAGIPAKSS